MTLLACRNRGVTNITVVDLFETVCKAMELVHKVLLMDMNRILYRLY